MTESRTDIDTGDRPIVLVANFRARPDKVVELRTRLEELARLSNLEPGCLQYELHTDDEDPLRLVFVETWASDGALAAHDVTDHVAAIRRDADALTSEPIVLLRLRRVTGR